MNTLPTFRCRFPVCLLPLALVPLAGLQAQSNYATPTTITTFAGLAGHYGTADGTGSAARFSNPEGVAVDAAGNIYVGDSYQYTVRKITPGGVVTTLAGVPGSSGGTDSADGPPRFNGPEGMAIDGAGTVYVADTLGAKIRVVTAAGVVTTLAGSGAGGWADGTGPAAIFDNPTSVALDGAGNLYVADSSNDVIRQIVISSGVVTTYAGLHGQFGTADGTLANARFNQPSGVAFDAAGNMYVADTFNYTIRKITPGGVVSTLAGTAGSSGSRDGLGSAARFLVPRGLAVDAAGNVYVADTGNCTIRKVTPAGLVTTLAGTLASSSSVDGTGGNAQFWNPNGVAVNAAGVLYIADPLNNIIRKGTTTGANDLDADGKPDITWQNTSSGDLGFWLMNGMTFSAWVGLGIIPTTWRVAATADFNADGQTDLLWENTSTGERYIWFMNGTTFSSGVSLGIVSTDLRMASAGDFNGDGKPDILWENTVTGKRVIWFMNGTTRTSSFNLGIVTTDWRIVGVADFNADGNPDILFENTGTGERFVWFMNGAVYSSGLSLGIVSTDWHIAAVADYNGDGQPDLLWENTVSGDRGFWLMNGTTFSSWVDLAVVTTDWRISN